MAELKIQPHEMADLFNTCPSCAHERGFHSIFRKQPRAKQDYDWLLVCPNCGATFDVGLAVTVTKRVLPAMPG